MRRAICQFLAGGCLGAAALLITAGPVTGFESSVEVTVETWTSPGGRAYVGVQASGEWAMPEDEPAVATSEYYSRWELMSVAQPWFRHYWVWVYRTADDEFLNPGSPAAVAIGERQPGIAVQTEAYGDLSLYLDVAVDPASAPAGSERRVTAQLTAGWMDAIGGYLSAYVSHDSVAVDYWTVDFGDGTAGTHPPDPLDPERLSVTHRYADGGTFDVVVTARVSGLAYAAIFAPGGLPAERVVPFSVDISNRAVGISALPVEYVPPVVTVGASPSGTLSNGSELEPDAEGHPALWWPRGLPCQLIPRAIVVREGFMRSGGITIGSATTRLVGYGYEAGVNDASAPTPSGRYAADERIQIQWNTPLPGDGSYPVQLVLELETTYDDGTVRTSEVDGQVDVTVIYSAVAGG